MNNDEIDWNCIMCRMTLFFVVMVVVGNGCTYINQKMGLEDDNPVEEYIEELIEDHTGVDVDLSGGSPEKNN